MTVERVASEQFHTTATFVADALVAILKEGQPGYQYRNSEISDSGMTVATTIWPKWWPLVVSTRLYIQIEPRATNLTVVTARTESQSFIMGDIFNAYRGYLNDLLSSLGRRCDHAV